MFKEKFARVLILTDFWLKTERVNWTVRGEQICSIFVQMSVTGWVVDFNSPAVCVAPTHPSDESVHMAHSVFCAPHSDINYTFSLIINPLIRARGTRRVVNASSVVINLRRASQRRSALPISTPHNVYIWIYGAAHIRIIEFRRAARSPFVYCKMIKFALVSAAPSCAMCSNLLRRTVCVWRPRTLPDWAATAAAERQAEDSNPTEFWNSSVFLH